MAAKASSVASKKRAERADQKAATLHHLKIAGEAKEKPLYADPDEVAAFAEGLPEGFLYCRELGHNWRPHTAGKYKDGGFERTLKCPRCRTEKHQEITSWGVILRVHYTHPDGYLHKGMGRIVGDGRGMMRLESIKRTMAKPASINAAAKKAAPAKKRKAS